MIKKELLKKSPLRILEKSMHGGVGIGNIGVMTARQGVGKTACLVHLATDKLMQGKHVIHVSYAGNTSHIIAWYEDIFEEYAQRLKIGNVMDLHDEVIRNRIIMNFSQSGTTVTQVVKSLNTLIKDGGFVADCIIVDGYDFKIGKPQDLVEYRAFAKALGIELWFSSSLKDEDLIFDEHGIPTILTCYLGEIAIIIFLKPEAGIIRLELKKDHDHRPKNDLHLKLDPKILLIAGDNE
ncbi:MAG: hypothetical protein EHM28_05200 [Spirochaetaceae bacterium]|nr:MAG: hypothetical protein EHM28_05200 [Spirochaetaceae bacterium]